MDYGMVITSIVHESWDWHVFVYDRQSEAARHTYVSGSHEVAECAGRALMQDIRKGLPPIGWPFVLEECGKAVTG